MVHAAFSFPPPFRPGDFQTKSSAPLIRAAWWGVPGIEQPPPHSLLMPACIGIATFRQFMPVLIYHRAMQSKQQIHELVDRLPESETDAAARYLEFLLTHDEAPIDPEMLKRIDAARAQQGAGIPHAEILREFGG